MLYKIYILYTPKHKINTIIIFFWNLGIVPATQTFSLCFQRLTKPTTGVCFCYDQPSDQNALGLTFTLCIVFIADFFSWLHVERFQVLYQTQSYQEKCWNYCQQCCRCCFLCMVIKLRQKMFFPHILYKF